MDLFVKNFKKEIPFTYPRQDDFLPKLGLCGTLSDGIFNSADTLITDKIGIEAITVETEQWEHPVVKEFYNIKNTRLSSDFKIEGESVVKSTKIKGKALFKLLNFESKGDFYYRAIHLKRDYIYNPKNQLEYFIKEAQKDGRWGKDEVVITSILYGKNPLILKAIEKGISIVGGEISAGLSFADINFKAGLIRNDKSISASYILDPDEEVVVGFQMMGLRGYNRKQLGKFKGKDTEYPYDIFENIHNDFSENEYNMEYVPEYM
jgi:hypothetical protein